MTTIASPYFMGEPMQGLAVPEPHHVMSVELPAGDPQRRMGVLYNALAGLVAHDERPVVYAGDCVSIIGVLSGLQRTGVEPTLLFLDAHGDFNTWDTTPSGFLGGMPLAMATGRGEQTIVDAAGLRPVPDERVFLVGARDLDPGEKAALAASAVTRLEVAELTSAIPSGPLYVHVDLDVIAPAEMPAMNYPAPGGPSVDSIADTMNALAATGRVAAFSLSSWNPALPGAEIAAAAGHRVAAPFLAGG